MNVDTTRRTAERFLSRLSKCHFSLHVFIFSRPSFFDSFSLSCSTL